jgi:ATP-binding cassette subfamily C protein
MAVVVGLYCLAALASLAGPLLLGEIVEEVQAGAGVAVIDRLAFAIGAFVVAQIVLVRAARYAGHRLGERTSARLREQFVDRALALPMAAVERAGTGDLMARSTGDVVTVGQMLRDAAPEIFVSGVQVVVIVGAVFFLHPLLGLCALAGAPPLLVAMRWYLRRARTAYLDEGAANTDVAEALAATVDGARTVEALGLEARRAGEGDASVEQALASRRRTLRLRTVLFPVMDTSYALPVAAMLFVGGLLHLNGVVTLGVVIAATVLLQQMVEPLDRVLTWMENLQRGGASYARLEGIALIGADTGTSTEVPVDDRLAVRRVRYAYSAARDVLHGVDLAVRPGERLAVVGPSGAGKSTLARLLAGLDRPREGSVTVGGVPVADLEPVELRRRVALITQDPHVFIGTLRDNLALAAPSAGDEEMLGALAAVDAGWLRALPDGLDTRVGAAGTALDASQVQQLALARVVLADPHTLILDEATSRLDPAAARHAERSLAAVLAGRTVIAIAHRLHTAHDAHRVAVMDGGRITELGSHDELVAAGGSYAALWRSWHGEAERPPDQPST